MCHTCITSLTRKWQKEPIQVFLKIVIFKKTRVSFFKQLIFSWGRDKSLCCYNLPDWKKSSISARKPLIIVASCGKKGQRFTRCDTFFFTHPSPNRKGVVLPFPPPPLPAFVLIFCSHPTIGGMWPRIFTLLTMGPWHLIQKISFKTGLKDGAGTAAWSEVETQKKHSSGTSYNFLVLGCVIPVSPR